jgi:folate-binding protein YgfZ
LEEYIVADEVEVADATAEWQGLAVLGPGAGAWATGAAAAAPGSVAFPGRRAAGESWDLFWPASAAEAMGPRLGAIAAGGADELERERIAAGIPAIPRDAGPADLPPEADLAAAAISYTKGCYTGQEVIARLKTRGRVRRSLRRVRGAGPAPAVPAPLWRGEKKIGEIRSAIAASAPGEFLGLAMVQADVPADAALALSAGADPAAATVRFCV